jgi:hypothetical protein
MEVMYALKGKWVSEKTFIPRSLQHTRKSALWNGN